MATTRESIVQVFTQVASDQDRELAPLEDDLVLVNCGLNSLSFAVVVATLEDTLNVDPFNSAEWVDFPVTFADFVQLYERAVAA